MWCIRARLATSWVDGGQVAHRLLLVWACSSTGELLTCTQVMRVRFLSGPLEVLSVGWLRSSHPCWYCSGGGALPWYGRVCGFDSLYQLRLNVERNYIVKFNNPPLLRGMPFGALFLSYFVGRCGCRSTAGRQVSTLKMGVRLSLPALTPNVVKRLHRKWVFSLPSVSMVGLRR